MSEHSRDPLYSMPENVEERYSDQMDGNYLCRDCGTLVKNGWLNHHDHLHEVIGWPLPPNSVGVEPAEDVETCSVCGGEVKWYADERFLRHVGSVDWTADHEAVIITPDSAAIPPCPFEMGERVRVKNHRMISQTVTGWFQKSGEWYVQLDDEVDDNGEPSGWLPSSLDYAAEPFTIDVANSLHWETGHVCPFPIGAKVRGKFSGEEGVVTGCGVDNGKPLVFWGAENSSDPEDLELVVTGLPDVDEWVGANIAEGGIIPTSVGSVLGPAGNSNDEPGEPKPVLREFKESLSEFTEQLKTGNLGNGERP